MRSRPSASRTRARADPGRAVFVTNRHPRLMIPRGAVARMIAILDRHVSDVTRNEACPAGELSIVFLTNAALARIHAGFLHDPTATDVITFEGSPGAGTAGEICVSADAALDYSRAHAAEFDSELTLYVVHGWLHLAGFDDLVPAKKRAMRRAEQRAMQVLQTVDAVPKFTLRNFRDR